MQHTVNHNGKAVRHCPAAVLNLADGSSLDVSF